MKEISPFSPGRPVPVEYFVGRRDEINKLIKGIKQTSVGQNINAFITGERGIGKSSLALFVKYLLENDNSLLPKDIKFLTAYCFLGPAKTLPEVCKLMVEKLISSIRDESLWGKIKSSLNKYIDSIGLDLFGIGVKVGFKKDLEDLPSDFYSIVKYIWNMVREKYKGIMLVLDDINGTTKIEGFSMFLKSFVDGIAVDYKERLPLFFLLVGIPERMDDLAREQPSTARIFDVIDLRLMSKEESREFVNRALESVKTGIAEEALNFIVQYSGGFPALLHEIGDAVYWTDKDNYISMDDAIDGIMVAAENVGRKYFHRRLYKEMQSKTHRRILYKMARSQKEILTRKDILAMLNDKEKKVIDTFLNKSINRGILRKLERGEYEFPSKLFELYVLLESIKEKNKPRGTA